MLRLGDYVCEYCGLEQEALVEVPAGTAHPKSVDLECDHCESTMAHNRVLSAPARYMGEVTHNPMISGGRFDTTGHKPLPQYPDLPGEAAYQERLSLAVQRNPKEDRVAVMRSMANEAPDIRDYGTHMSKPECREISKERKRIANENAQKRKRIAALKAGQNVNMRKDRCAGDPRLN